MTGDDLIALLLALPAEVRALTVTTWGVGDHHTDWCHIPITSARPSVVFEATQELPVQTVLELG